MTERNYPAEPPVDLRSVRKITPPVTADPDFPAEQDAAFADAAFDEGYETTDIEQPTFADPDADDFTASGDELSSTRPTVAQLTWDLLPSPPGAETDPAQWGAKGWANTVTGGLLRLRPKTPEIEYRRARAAVAQQWQGRQMIMVANLKGGEGKTITTLTMANIFASLRGGSVVAWDTSEAEGTLAYRAAVATPDRSVWDLLANAEALVSPHAEVSALSRFLRMQPSKAEVLASDDSALRMAQINADHCRSIYSVLRRFRDLVIVDTGNNRRASNWLWAAHNADLLVVPMTYREDSAVTVCRMFEALQARGLHSLVANAIVVLTVPPSGASQDKQDLIRRALNNAGVRNAVAVPFDGELAGGGRIDHARLHEETVQAWTRVCAMAATSLAASSQARGMELTAGPAPRSYEIPPELGVVQPPPPSAPRRAASPEEQDFRYPGQRFGA